MAEPLSGAAPQGHNIFGNITQADYLEFLDRYSDADERVRQAVAARKQLRDEIKAEGIPLPSFDRTRRDRDKSGEVREREDAWYRRMMAWERKPVGFQASIDIANDPAVDPETRAIAVHELKRIDNEGQTAGLGGSRRDSNPYTPGTEEHQRWDIAWARGNAEKVSDSGTGEDNGTPRRRGRPPGTGKRQREAAEAAARAAAEDTGPGSSDPIH